MYFLYLERSDLWYLYHSYYLLRIHFIYSFRSIIYRFQTGYIERKEPKDLKNQLKSLRKDISENGAGINYGNRSLEGKKAKERKQINHFVNPFYNMALSLSPFRPSKSSKEFRKGISSQGNRRDNHKVY